MKKFLIDNVFIIFPIYCFLFGFFLHWACCMVFQKCYDRHHKKLDRF